MMASCSCILAYSAACNRSFLWMILLRQQSTAMATAPTPNSSTNNFFSPSAECFRSKTTPIITSTNPTIRLPHTIDKVLSMFTASFFPSAIEMTSFEASILKQPPRKKPQPALSKKYVITSGSIPQKKPRTIVREMEEQKSEYDLRFLRMEARMPSPGACCLQNQPRKEEPKRVPASKTMGIVKVYFLKPLWFRQVGIQSKKPQRMDFSSPIDSRYSRFSVSAHFSRENAINYLNLIFPETLTEVEASSLRREIAFSGF